LSSKKSVFFDANILYSWNLNHLLMFFCDTGVGLIEPYWSDVVVEEALRNIKEKTGDDVSARFEQMNIAYPYANVSGHEIMEDVDGVHQNDQHVAKAAIQNECDFLQSYDFKHFKNAPMLQKKPRVLTPDSFLTALFMKYPSDSIKATALAWWHKENTGTFDDYLSFLGRKTGGLSLVNFETHTREHIKELGKVPDELSSDLLKSETKRY
jgi:hypothetical protein